MIGKHPLTVSQPSRCLYSVITTKKQDDRGSSQLSLLFCQSYYNFSIRYQNVRMICIYTIGNIERDSLLPLDTYIESWKCEDLKAYYRFEELDTTW